MHMYISIYAYIHTYIYTQSERYNKYGQVGLKHTMHIYTHRHAYIHTERECMQLWLQQVRPAWIETYYACGLAKNN